MAQARSAGYRNHLADQTSPYLRQHADNPVDWYPWGTDALERARREHRPILLSIGYSACHWCHVMAHESFEDEETARLMNERFVNIKVDREERPDLDRIYQIAHQMLTQRGGGWPLTMFLMSDDQRPFFGGTYFPKDAGHGLPAFRQVLERVAEYHAAHEGELRSQNDALMEAFAQTTPPPAEAGVALSDAPLIECRSDLERSFDTRYGGFGGAPKFPHATTLERLLRDWHASAVRGASDTRALAMATLTLTRMAEGGLYDQVGGGFCRYSVDQYWMIPHFEKMLYDNGALLAAYSAAALATGEPLFARVAQQTAAWMIRDMQSPEGGFYSSLDADSAGHEGLFYVWEREAVKQLLTSDEFSVFARRFGLDRPPNFEGKWHLHAFVSLEQIAQELGGKCDAAQLERLLNAARAKLLAVRNARIWPGRDEKILTSWNALAIRGLAIAARALGGADAAHGAALTDAATRALDFIRRALWREGRLLATYKDGRAHLNAYLDDYAYLADAVLELQQLRLRPAELAFARELLEVLLQHFADHERGGFFFTADDHEQLIHRPKSFADEATPAGNGVAAFALQRAGYLLGEPRFLDAAERTLRGGWQAMLKYPPAHTSMLAALEERLHAPQLLILRGEPRPLAAWQEQLSKRYAPGRVVIAVPADAAQLPPALADKPLAGEAVAYLCRGFTCSAPYQSLTALLEDLGAGP